MDLKVIVHRLNESTRGALTAALLVASTAAPVPCMAQALDLLVDATVGTGAVRASTEGKSVTTRAPAFLDIDVGLVLDNDFSSEWGVGARIGLEADSPTSLAPQVRLVKPKGGVNYYLGGGLPLVVAPQTALGAAIDVGARYPLNEIFGLSIGGQIAVFFAGERLTGDTSSVTEFTLAVGGQARF